MIIRPSNMDYCPKCRKRRPHVRVGFSKMCKICFYQEKALKIKLPANSI